MNGTAKNAFPALRVGEKVVYRGQGVSEVVRMESRQVAGRPCKFAVLKPLGSDATIWLPLGRAEVSEVRSLMPPKIRRAVYRVLRSKSSPAPAGCWARRQRDYQQRLRDGNPEQVAAVVRDLARIGHRKELSFSEKKTFDAARALLVTELAVASRKPEARVSREIDRLCRS